MAAIVTALQSIPGMIMTREMKLVGNEKQVLLRLEQIIAKQGGHEAYREALQNIGSPFAIPWLGAHSPSSPSPTKS